MLEVRLAIQVGRLHIALVLVGLEHNEVSWHKLVAKDLDDLADFEILPVIGSEYAGRGVCS